MNTLKTYKFSLISLLPILVFFTGSFIYFAFFGDYVLFYQEKSSLFIFSIDFLVENLHQPGGPILWLGKLITTFFYYPLAGAFIVAAILTLIVSTSSKIMRFYSRNNSLLFPCIIGLFLFFLQTNYMFLVYNITGILLQLAFFYLLIKNLTWLKGWIPVILLPLWYFASGGFVWGYLILLTLHFALDKNKEGLIKIAALWSLSILTFHIAKEFLFFQSGYTLLTFPYTGLNTGSQQRLFLLAVIVSTSLPLLAKFRVSLPKKIQLTEFASVLAGTGLVIVILVIIGVQKYDRKTSQYFQVEKLFSQEKYDEVIAYNRANPSTNTLTIFLNNIALCEEGKLNDLLFNFPQSADGRTLFLKWEMVGEILRRGGYFYYTIGIVNEAHRWAFENMVMKGLSPEGLKMLIKTDLINGNFRVASRYIGILKNTLSYSKEAKEYEKLLFNEMTLNDDVELGEKRKERLKTDFFSITDDPYINIERILATDSLNKKVFEYKIAFLLLKKDYQGIANELPKFERFGFTKFPTHIEEAVIALSVLNPGKVPNIGTIKISKETELRWEQYLTVFQQYGTNPKAAEPALRKQFGNTFWYWAFYR
jgi:hypothetical protein